MNRVCPFFVWIAVWVSWTLAADQPSLRQVSGDMIISVATSWSGEWGIMHGPNVSRNRKLILKHFNGIQPAVYATWGGFWPQEAPVDAASFRFWTEPLASQAVWAKQHGLHVLHHGILAPNYYFPEWWKTSDYPPEEMELILKRYVEAVVSVPNVDAWNMFNEMFLGDGRYFPDGPGDWDNRWVGLGMEPDASGLTGDAKVNPEHPRFIRLALEHAGSLTDGVLELREGTTFQNPRKLDAMVQLVLHLKNKGVHLDAVGLQGHLDAGEEIDLKRFRRNVERFRQAGVDVYITELDVGLPKGVDPSTVDWSEVGPRQAEAYSQIVRAAREASVSLISVWGLMDTEDGGWRSGERALLLDPDGGTKPAYHAVRKALETDGSSDR
jgi:GH35 family endo-1,4-beta-xylanase